MKKYSIAFLMLFGLGQQVNAADVTITPPSDGGFSVNKQTGSAVFRVDAATGGVFIPNLPEALGDIPLCWSVNSGLLSACQGSSGGDTTPPNITSNAPALATQAQQTFTISCSDNNELLYCGTPTSQAMESGVKTFTSDSRSQRVSLASGGYSEIVTATDMAGNSTKYKIDIKLPPVGIALKTYKSITPSIVPSGFDCRGLPYPSSDGTKINQVIASDLDFFSSNYYGGWTEAAGYILSISATTAIGNNMSRNFFYLRSDGKTDLNIGNLEVGPLRIPLGATSAAMPRTIMSNDIMYPVGIVITSFKGNVEYIKASDELRITVSMECGKAANSNDPLTWVEGVSFAFTASP